MVNKIATIPHAQTFLRVIIKHKILFFLTIFPLTIAFLPFGTSFHLIHKAIFNKKIHTKIHIYVNIVGASSQTHLVLGIICTLRNTFP